MMKIECKLMDGVAILELKGPLDCANGDRHLRDIVDHLVKEGREKVVFNLADVCHMDTTCLGLLVAAHVRFHQMGGALHLCAVPDRISHVLSIAKLNALLRQFPAEDAAIAAFSGPRRQSELTEHTEVREQACMRPCATRG